ncbi:hypothetical protein [Methanonatronarchaeum sp. AMET6-2]|uniref:hypothetical protein n=1 Tax=Methanonatronarchaeum sp. AMET6-2 TaxID=2933293 RepID=UPI00120CAE07|nr:hypothetical protein [Methanonatronarchaeum sp. AMET6-2]RZN62551.1 MAG: hypothetical protein EF811_02710 [Methanonatronarchaeia archaeon]UOY10167.1 hypothetical protein MU439_00570 [Methanonatronarchaeum sp. AMET6-2]
MSNNLRQSRLLKTLIYIESKLANPVIKRILKSRLHWPLSTRLLILNYRGHKSGQEITTPLFYIPKDSILTVITRRNEVSWWRNFKEEYPAYIWYRGDRKKTVGKASTDSETIKNSLKEILARSPHWKVALKVYGVPINPSDKQLEEYADKLVAVEFDKPISDGWT